MQHPSNADPDPLPLVRLECRDVPPPFVSLEDARRTANARADQYMKRITGVSPRISNERPIRRFLYCDDDPTDMEEEEEEEEEEEDETGIRRRYPRLARPGPWVLPSAIPGFCVNDYDKYGVLPLLNWRALPRDANYDQDVFCVPCVGKEDPLITMLRTGHPPDQPLPGTTVPPPSKTPPGRTDLPGARSTTRDMLSNDPNVARIIRIRVDNWVLSSIAVHEHTGKPYPIPMGLLRSVFSDLPYHRAEDKFSRYTVRTRPPLKDTLSMFAQGKFIETSGINSTASYLVLRFFVEALRMTLMPHLVIRHRKHENITASGTLPYSVKLKELAHAHSAHVSYIAHTKCAVVRHSLLRQYPHARCEGDGLDERHTDNDDENDEESDAATVLAMADALSLGENDSEEEDDAEGAPRGNREPQDRAAAALALLQLDKEDGAASLPRSADGSRFRLLVFAPGTWIAVGARSIEELENCIRVLEPLLYTHRG